jgi:hypothetical protein
MNETKTAYPFVRRSATKRFSIGKARAESKGWTLRRSDVRGRNRPGLRSAAASPNQPPRLEGLQQIPEQANQALGRLDGLASILADLSLFIYTHVRKEALLPSQIEGTQSSLSDLLMFENDEAPGVPAGDGEDVSNYVAAMDMVRRGCEAVSRCHFGCFARFTGFFFRRDAAARNNPASSGAARTGSAARAPEMPFSFHHLPELVVESMVSLELFLHSNNPDMPVRSRRAWRICSSKPFTLSRRKRRAGTIADYVSSVRSRCDSRADPVSKVCTLRPIEPLITSCWSGCGPRASGRCGSIFSRAV